MTTRRRGSGTPKSGAEVLTLKGHTGSVVVGVVQPRRLADRHREVMTTTAKVWDAASGAEVLTLKGHTGSVLSASFSPDGSRIVTAQWDGTAKVWDAMTGAERPHPQGAHRLRSVRRRSAPTARGSSPGVMTTAKVWDATSGAEVLTLKGHTGSVLSASFSPDGSRIVTAGGDTHGAGLGRVERRRGPHPQGAHRSRPIGVVQPRRLAHRHRGADGTAKVWDASSGAEVLTLKGHTDSVRSASFSPDGSRIATREP